MAERRVRGKAEKTAELRRRIMDVSVELFFENGYEKTTTRQILQRAGILNGSLYNIYHGKEEIFADIVEEALDDSVRASERFMKDPTFLDRIGFPIILEIYASFRSPRIAEFLSIAHRKWDIMQRVCDLMKRWIEDKDTEHLIDTESDEFRVRMYMCLGAMGNIIEAVYRDPESISEKDAIIVLVTMLLEVFGLPSDGVEAKTGEIFRAIDGNDIVICGIHL